MGNALIEGKSFLASGTVWGVLVAYVLPIVAAKLKITPDEVLSSTNILIGAAGSLFALYKRVTAKKKITSL